MKRQKLSLKKQQRNPIYSEFLQYERGRARQMPATAGSCDVWMESDSLLKVPYLHLWVSLFSQSRQLQPHVVVLVHHLQGTGLEGEE